MIGGDPTDSSVSPNSSGIFTIRFQAHNENASRSPFEMANGKRPKDHGQR